MNFLTLKIPLGPDNRPLSSHEVVLYLPVYLDRDGNEVSYSPPQEFETAKFLAGITLSRAQPAEVRKVTLRIKTKIGRMPAATPPELLEQVRRHHRSTLEYYPNPKQKMNRIHSKWLLEAERDFPAGVERLAEFRRRKSKSGLSPKTGLKPGKKSSSTGRSFGG
jgi:hypothetical protein